MEFIIEIIGEIFIGIIWEPIRIVVSLILSGVWWGAHFLLKLITLNKAPMEEIEIEYKDSSKPYFLILGVCIMLYFIINGLN